MVSGAESMAFTLQDIYKSRSMRKVIMDSSFHYAAKDKFFLRPVIARPTLRSMEGRSNLTHEWPLARGLFASEIASSYTAPRLAPRNDGP